MRAAKTPSLSGSSHQNADFFTQRDRHAKTFDTLLNLERPRATRELPNVDPEIAALDHPPLVPGDPPITDPDDTTRGGTIAPEGTALDDPRMTSPGISSSSPTPSTSAPSNQSPTILTQPPLLSARGERAPAAILQRDRIRPLRRRRVHARTTDELDQLLTETVLTLGALAAEAAPEASATP